MCVYIHILLPYILKTIRIFIDRNANRVTQKLKISICGAGKRSPWVKAPAAQAWVSEFWAPTPHKIKMCLEPSALSSSQCSLQVQEETLSHRNKMEHKRKTANIPLWPLGTCHTCIHIHCTCTKSVSQVPHDIYVIFQPVFWPYFYTLPMVSYYFRDFT